MNYTEQIEKQNEELQKKLAMSEREVTEYKDIIESRKGKLVILEKSFGLGSGEVKSRYMAEIVIQTERDNNNQWVYRIVKDRSGKRQDKIYTIEQIREFALNFWE